MKAELKNLAIKVTHKQHSISVGHQIINEIKADTITNET